MLWNKEGDFMRAVYVVRSGKLMIADEQTARQIVA